MLSQRAEGDRLSYEDPGATKMFVRGHNL